MKSGLWGLNGILLGLLAALLSGGLVLGSFILSLSEAGQLPAAPAGITQPAPRMTALPPLPTATPPPPEASSPTSSPASANTQTATPTATTCPPPAGWILIDVDPNLKKIKDIANNYGITIAEFRDANCLHEPGPWLPAWKDQVYVPELTPAPTPTLPYFPPPWNWTPYPPYPSPWPTYPTDTPMPPPPPPGNISNSPTPAGPPPIPPPTGSTDSP